MTSSTEKLTQREEEIIAILSRAFEGLMLDSRVVDVHKLDGGTVSTLRFTLNEAASSDLERDEIEESGKSVEEMAERVSGELREQL